MPYLPFQNDAAAMMAGCTGHRRIKHPFSVEELMERHLAKVG